MLPLRNKKAQGNLETLVLIGGAVLIAVIVITIITSLGSNSRKTATDQSDQAVSSTDVPFAPNIVAVDARYADCVDSPNNALLRFSWKPISNQGTFRLIIEDSSNDVVGNLDYVVLQNSEIQDMNNLNPNITTDVLVSEINLGTGKCGDSYFLSIEVNKNNQTQLSRKYPFNWNKQGDKTVLVYRPSLDPTPGAYNISQFPLSVQLNVPDPTGYIIYYTTDGSTPTTSSTIYNGSGITINPGQTIKTFADNAGVVSTVATGTYISSYYTVDTPLATPGTSINLTTPFTVSLASTTSNADIYYSLNGTTPDCSGSFFLYSSPISVSSDLTITTIGCKTDYIDSPIGTYNYTFFVPLDALTITPVGGDYNSIQNVTVTSTNPGAIIHYTLTGIDPTLMSPIYSGPISISSNTTLKAKAFVGTFESPMSTEDYNITLPAIAPVFNPVSGTYSVDQSVLLSSTTPVPYTIRYTTDGSDPIITSTSFAGSVLINSNTTLKAKTFKTGWSNSPTSTATYNFALAPPTFNPLPGAYSDSQTIQINSAAGSQVRYTLDGTIPTLTTGTLINAGESTIPITSTKTLRAISFKTGWSESNVNLGNYIINAPAASPTFNPNGGTYTNSVSVSLSCATSGSSIRYTTDGSIPTRDVGLVYSGAITLTTTTTINAVCYASGYSTSPVVTNTFTINLIALAPTIIPAGGNFTSTTSALLSTTTPLPYTIRYTTDGSDPIATSAAYTGSAIPITENTIIKAITFKTGYTQSPTTTATFNLAYLAPTFNPTAPSNHEDSVAIQINASAGAIIKYTLDGSNPTPTTGTQILAGEYTIPITSTSTLKAIAYRPNWNSSPIASGIFTINAPAATPIFNPNGGTHTNSVSVSLSCATPSSSIRYTTDGSMPTRDVGQVYSSAINLTTTTTINAVCYATGYSTSSVATQTFTIQLIALAPTITPAGGNFTSTTSALLSTTTPLPYTIRYTTDGSDPIATSSAYTGSAIPISENTTLKVKTFKSGYIESPTTTATFNLAYLAPTFNPTAPSNHEDSVAVQINASAGAIIRYTLDGSNPTPTTGTQILAGEYTTLLTSTTALKAIAYRPNWDSSPIASGVFTINAPASTPTFNPNGGTHINSVSVSISCITSGSSIRYTNDGTDPTRDIGIIYSGAINLTSTTTLKAVCYATGYSTSLVATQTFTVNITPDPVVVSGAGTFCNSALLTASGGSGGLIYYQGTTSNGTSTANQTTTATVTSTGTYYFRSKSIADVWGPQGSAAVIINLNPTAPTSVSGTTNVCSGNSTTLTAVGGTGTGYQWYAGGCGTGSVLSTANTLVVSPSSTTTYFVRTTNPCGVSSCTSQIVTITAAPVVTVTPSTNCGAGNVTLSATTTEGTINWYSSATGGSAIGTGNNYTTYLSSTTTFYVDVAGASCSLPSRVPVTGTIESLPSAVSVSLQNSGPGFATISASGGTGGTIYFQDTTSNGTSTSLGGSPQTVNTNGIYYFRSRSSAGCWGVEGSLGVIIPVGLSSLVLSNNPGYYNFSSSTYNYNGIRYLISTTNNITVTSTGPGNITVNGTPVSSGSPSSAISISDGTEKTIDVTVTDGGNSATYTLKVTKIITSGGSASEGISGGYAYRVHRFTSGGTFNSNLGLTTKLLVVGGGGGGGPYSGAGGDAGRYVYNASYALTSGAKTIIIGTGGRTNNTWPRTRTNGTSSAFGSVTALGGATGLEGYSNGKGGANGLGVPGASFAAGGAGAPGISNTISGTSVVYAKGGNGGTGGQNGTVNSGNGGDGGYDLTMTRGGSGVVIVRIEIPV